MCTSKKRHIAQPFSTKNYQILNFSLGHNNMSWTLRHKVSKFNVALSANCCVNVNDKYFKNTVFFAASSLNMIPL